MRTMLPADPVERIRTLRLWQRLALDPEAINPYLAGDIIRCLIAEVANAECRIALLHELDALEAGS